MSKKILFTPLEKRILNMALNDDDKLCSFYAKELFEHINLADVIKKQIREKLACILKVEYDYARDIVFYTERKKVIKRNGKTAPIGIYRLEPSYKPKIRELLTTLKQDETQG